MMEILEDFESIVMFWSKRSLCKYTCLAQVSWVRQSEPLLAVLLAEQGLLLSAVTWRNNNHDT